jgi:hypothetical protein
MHLTEHLAAMNWQPLEYAMARREWFDTKRTRLFLHRYRGA